MCQTADHFSPHYFPSGQKVLEVPTIPSKIKGGNNCMRGVLDVCIDRKDEFSPEEKLSGEERDEKTSSKCVGLIRPVSQKPTDKFLLELAKLVTNKVKIKTFGKQLSTEEDKLHSDGKTSAQLMFVGHQCPILSPYTCTSFCTLSNLQPMYVPLAKGSNGGKVSMYSQWRVANVDPNPPGLSTKSMLNLYESERHDGGTVDTMSWPQLYSSCAMSSSQIGVLTHSSYWKYYNINSMEESLETEGDS